MSFEKPPGLKNTHPTEYQLVPGTNKIIKITTDPGFFVRALVHIPVTSPGVGFAADSSNEKCIPKPTLTMKDENTAEVAFCARARSDPLGTKTTIHVGVADLAGKIVSPFDSLDVIVGDRADKAMILRVGPGSVAAESTGGATSVSEYKLGTVLKFKTDLFDPSAGTPRGDMIIEILAASKKAPKPVSVATEKPNTLGTQIRHLVFGCHAKDPRILAIGEGFRRARDPTKVGDLDFGPDPIIGDAKDFSVLSGAFKVVWLSSCAGGSTDPYKEFIRGVATKMNCFALGALAAVSETPRHIRVGGKLVKEQPLLKDQVDMYRNPFIASPTTAPGGGGSVFEGDFLRARRSLGFTIAEYDGLPVDDDPL